MKRMDRYVIAMLGCACWMLCAASRPLPAAPKKPVAKKATNTLVVQGRVKALTRPPRPRSVPYKDAIIALHLTGVKALHGKPAKKEIVVFLWGMRNNKWTPAASCRRGQMVKLQLEPWEKMERKYGSYNRFELEGKDAWALDTYWGEVKK